MKLTTATTATEMTTATETTNATTAAKATTAAAPRTRRTGPAPSRPLMRCLGVLPCLGLLFCLGAEPVQAARAAPAALVEAAAAGPAVAQTLSQRLGLHSMVAQSAPDCTGATGAIVYDDGGFENAISAPVANGLQVMRFDLPANAAGVQQVCVALTRLAASSTADLAFDVVFYAADGPSGAPGTQLASVPATATGVPVSSNGTVNTQFYAVAIGSALTLPAARTIYVGAQFDGSQGFFVGVDESATTQVRTAYLSSDGGSTWAGAATADADPHFHAFGIRVDPILSQTNCVPTTTAMCLQGGRFQVTATFQAPGAAAGQAQTVSLTDDSGYLWFFTASNIEAIVKVLDGCALNQHFWVFAGGLTNVEATITVTDTQTGKMRTYTNPQNKAFQPIQDTSALPCP
jgi:hypothetical protein